MPRTTFPPTPASSMDIIGKDGESQYLPKEKNTFVLPPPAIAPAPACDASIGDAGSETAQKASEYSLPPPPTRTRKIIQMTPKTQLSDGPADSSLGNASAKTRSAGASASSAKGKTAAKKQPSSTSQAGKRIARKTAHSVIERRRRSKMNEEFGVLKDMIPACKDQDMHKLAILQASIDYLRYLEQCIGDLKAANGVGSASATQKSPKPFQQFTPPQYQAHEEDDEDDEDTDVEMTETPILPPLRTIHLDHAPVYTSPQSTTTSPALAAIQHQNAMSQNSSLSALPSPTVGPQMSAHLGLHRQYTSSASTSPALIPTSSKEADEEATAALMMLNKDRRNTNSSNHSSSGRGMSVKELLSS
ncbi:MAG: hypothetical protein L6R42_004061 [Xanthoria sp. 1 TBL-2021]|nr:MAG: hypothetical protein L6R42_004061 [Xanthoria sp. 1 TBL-2021]